MSFFLLLSFCILSFYLFHNRKTQTISCCGGSQGHWGGGWRGGWGSWGGALHLGILVTPLLCSMKCLVLLKVTWLLISSPVQTELPPQLRSLRGRSPWEGRAVFPTLQGWAEQRKPESLFPLLDGIYL